MNTYVEAERYMQLQAVKILRQQFYPELDAAQFSELVAAECLPGTTHLSVYIQGLTPAHEAHFDRVKEELEQPPSDEHKKKSFYKFLGVKFNKQPREIPGFVKTFPPHKLPQELKEHFEAGGTIRGLTKVLISVILSHHLLFDV